nr:M23 family metallopeptidase [Fumia xinanensis]
MDITGGGVFGANIVAAASGTVIQSTSHYSYGNYIIVDHGGGYSTLYAHASQLLVSIGQKVEQGQTIAKVGSTGNSTGPHLHFEVRVNGKHQNPANYVHA